jgi:hypothetical protein
VNQMSDAERVAQGPRVLRSKFSYISSALVVCHISDDLVLFEGARHPLLKSNVGHI